MLELVTPSLDGVILPGVVRQSLLDLARTWVRALCLWVAGMMGCCCVGGLHFKAPRGGCGILADLCPFSLGDLSPQVSLSLFSGRERQDSAARGASGSCVLLPQGEFRVVERKVTMKELLRALEEGRVREVFGSGTACQVCPVHQILYQGKVRWGCHW